MSGEGGDTGGSDKGGMSGGGDANGGGDIGGGFDNGGAFQPPGGWTAANSGSLPGDVADYGGAGGGGAMALAPDASADAGGLSSFINNPVGGNLSGPGPVGGDPGQPGVGGGTNTPFSWDNVSIPNLDGINASSFTGNTPVASGGVSSSGGPGADSLGGVAAQNAGATFDSLVNSSSPAGTSAGAIAAPLGVAGNTDISSGTNLNSAKPTTPVASNGNSGNNGGILSSLGLSSGNALGAAVSGIGLVNNLVNGKQAPAGSAPLAQTAGITSGVADQQTQAGQALQQWQTTGTLPASYESQVQQAAQAAKTRAISNAAAQGLPTDPTQNTALAQQINAIDTAIPGQREQIAAQLAQSGQQMVNAGLAATGVSSSIYQNLAKMEQDQNTARGAAIANFASALNGGGNKGLTLKVA